MNNRKVLAGVLSLSLLLGSMTQDVSASSKKKIVFQKTKITVNTGKKVTLKVTLKNLKKKTKLVWSVNHKELATVSGNGIVKAGKKPGTVTVKVSVKDNKKISATCKVTIKANKVVKPTPTVKPTKKPEVTKQPQMTESPEPSMMPMESPAITQVPDSMETSTPSATPTATASSAPTTTNQPSQGGGNAPSATEEAKALLCSKTIQQDGKTKTVYIVNRGFNGSLTIALNGHGTTQNGNAGFILSLLASTALTKTNSDGSITVSRSDFDSPWKVTDNTISKDYYMTVYPTYTEDSNYTNCGAVVFEGDVLSEVSVS